MKLTAICGGVASICVPSKSWNTSRLVGEEDTTAELSVEPVVVVVKPDDMDSADDGWILGFDLLVGSKDSIKMAGLTLSGT